MLNPYHALLTMPWWRFHLTVVLIFVAINGVFALGYILSGPDALEGTTSATAAQRYLEAFFFSVHTITTVGYGHVAPRGVAVNILVTAELYVGLTGFALATGAFFARISRPTAKVLFSRRAVVAPYKGKTAFQFRIVNVRANQLIDVHVKVVMSMLIGDSDNTVRRFRELHLERDSVALFPLHWTIVHPIDERSPLFGLTESELIDSEAEFLIVLTATDDTMSQNVNTRSSYKADELIWNARFTDLFHETRQGGLTVDLRCLHDVEAA